MTKFFGLSLVVIASLCVAQFSGCTNPPDRKDKKKQRKQVDEDDDNIPNPKVKVKIEDLEKGTGPEAKKGDTVYVYYTGKFENGEQFDSNKGKRPLKFTIGKPGIIQGWHQGLLGMKEGGKRKLIIPPELGYGDQSYGPIPANSTLTFDIELVKLEKEQE